MPDRLEQVGTLVFGSGEAGKSVAWAVAGAGRGRAAISLTRLRLASHGGRNTM